MNQVIFDDNIRYDTWVKLVLVFTLVGLVVLAALFYMDGHHSNVFPKEPPRESRIAFVVLCFSTVLNVATYWLFLPQKIIVSQEGIGVKFGGFSWNIPFKSIITVKAAKGLFVWCAYSAITSYQSQIVIVRKNRLKIRISPARRDLFLEYANRALADWNRVHQPGGNSS